MSLQRDRLRLHISAILTVLTILGAITVAPVNFTVTAQGPKVTPIPPVLTDAYQLRSGTVVNVRGCASTRNCDVIATLPGGSLVGVLGTVTGERVSGSTVWLKIVYEDQDAYVHDSLAEPFTFTTGFFLRDDRRRGALGELTIDNTDGSADAVGILMPVDSDEIVFAVYVERGDTYTVNRIADGEYELYFTIGSNWDVVKKGFRTVLGRSVFDSTFDFATTATQYTGWSVTLYRTEGGNAETPPVDEEDFPKP